MVNVTKTKTMSMQEYMSRIQNLNRKVATGGFNFDDRALALFYLLGLPLDVYEGLVRSLENDEDKLTSKNVKSKLLLEEKRMQRLADDEAEDVESSKALATKAKGMHGKKTKKYDSNRNTYNKHESSTSRFVICFACGRKGHIAKHCDLKHKDAKHVDEKEPNKSDETKHADTVMTRHRVLCSKKGPTNNNNRWLLDSGATDHMTPHKNKLNDYAIEKTTVCTANGEKMNVIGVGTATIKLKNEYGGWILTLTNVLHVPDLEDNLISMSRIEEKGYKQIIKNGRVEVMDDEVTIFTAFRSGHLYCIEEKDEIRSANAVINRNTVLWHRRMGHAHIRSLNISETIDDHQSDDKTAIDNACTVCIKGKIKSLNFPKHEKHQTTAVLELIHSDVVGKISPQSLGKAKYFVTFIDDFSRYTCVRVIQKKSDVLQEFDTYRREVENKHERKIKVIRNDNGGEYKSGAFTKYLQEHGIKQQFTVPYTPQQNGVAERANQTLLGSTRCQLIEAGMPNCFWAESQHTACHVRNRCKSVAIGGKVPHEIWTGKQDDLSYLRVFGCRAWAKSNQENKLSERAIECVFLGYQKGVKGYRLWHLAERHVIVSRNVIFEENVFPFMVKRVTEPLLTINNDYTSETSEDGANSETLLISLSDDEGELRDDEHVTEENRLQNDDPENNGDHNEENDTCQNEEYDENDEHHQVQDTAKSNRSKENTIPPLRRSKRNRKEVDRFCYTSSILNDDEPKNKDPLTPEDALAGIEAPKWHEAMVEEMNNLKQNKTWTIVERPMERNVVGSKWIFRKKYDNCGTLIRYKARLVAQGFSQKEGVDYNETYSLVVKIKTIRLLMALSVEMGWENEHVDITAAYLNSKLSDVVYMEQPKHFEEKTRDKYVCLLLKSIYGLHQSGREWNECIDAYLKEMGLTQSQYDPCVYYDGKGDLILALYVDDLPIFGKRQKINKCITALNERFQIKILGELTCLLSLCVEKPEKNSIIVHQTPYAKDVLKAFNMEESRGAKTPLVVGEYYTTTVEETCEGKPDEATYRRAIGCLLYLSNGSRPDLTCSVLH